MPALTHENRELSRHTSAPRLFRSVKVFVLAGGLFALAAHASAASMQVLYAFPESGAAGCYPAGTLLRDQTDALYGATLVCGAYNQGTLFKLKPPGPGQTKWSPSVLYTFRGGTDGSFPSAELVMDASGALYGTAEFGGRNDIGVVFKLTPPAPGMTKWTQTILHDFSYNFATGDHDGANPGAGLLQDATGTLYGTTIGGGTSSFSGVGFGTVFRLKPPVSGQTKWTETVLYRFRGGGDGRSPLSTLIADGAGALYGTTLFGGKGTCTDEFGNVSGCGTVFKLTPPQAGGTAWTKTTLYRFSGGIDGGSPRGAFIRDKLGAFYGATYQGGKGRCTGGIPSIVIGCGTVFKLTPPAPGQTVWTESVLYSFMGPGGAFPQGGLIADRAGNLYGTASGGGGRDDGVVYKLVPPAPGKTAWTQTVLHSFDILSSGENPVGELASNSTGQLFGVAYRGGQGLVGTVFKIAP